MTIKKHLLVRNVVALFAATPLLWIAPPAFAQSAPTQDFRPAQDSDLTRQELARFDQFLDSHGEFLRSHSSLSEQLCKNPSLVRNQEFMATHPELQEYLKAHPAAQTQLTENPESFIKSARQLNATTKSSISTNTTGSVKTPPPDASKPPKQ